MTQTENIPFYSQIGICVVVVIVSLLNLSCGWGDKHLWTILLTTSLGILVPHFKINPINTKNDIEVN
jgi:hypothetical protein